LVQPHAHAPGDPFAGQSSRDVADTFLSDGAADLRPIQPSSRPPHRAGGVEFRFVVAKFGILFERLPHKVGGVDGRGAALGRRADMQREDQAANGSEDKLHGERDN
jgi:hypothetical protein